MVRWFAVNSEDNAVDERDYFGAFRFAVFQKPFGRWWAGQSCQCGVQGTGGQFIGGGPPHGTESESSSE
jgi:hypothetical protein